MFGDNVVRAVGWLVSPILSTRFPRLNSAAWNAQYKLGLWYPEDITAPVPPGSGGAQLLSLVGEFSPNARILDLGCGTSVTLPLSAGNYAHYHGVDISAAAIERARAFGRLRTSFEVADILTYEPAERYDAVLLREVLYYFSAKQTAELLRRAAGFLASDGKVYVQLSKNGRSAFTTPGQFLDVIRNCGLAVLAEGVMKPSQGQGGSLFVLGRTEHGA